MTATEELRRLLDERGVEWTDDSYAQLWCTVWHGHDGKQWRMTENMSGMLTELKAWQATPEQAIEATLGREPWVNPAWERWHKSLRHDEIKSIGDAVEQLMYEVIEFGGDMGPNGNTCNGIDEGDVLTSGFINEWIARFESTLGRDRYSYEQWCEISNAVGDAMEYAHDRAIEHPDVADPLWNLDEYVNRILKVAFEGEATLGRGTCEVVYCEDACGTDGWYCNGCGEWFAATFRHTGHDNLVTPHFCPNCGRKVVNE